MATFKVGQRVRVIAPWSSQRGKTGAIYGAGKTFEWHVRMDIAGSSELDCIFPGRWAFDSRDLAPLTDSGADEFIENMERFARVVPRVPVTG